MKLYFVKNGIEWLDRRYQNPVSGIYDFHLAAENRVELKEIAEEIIRVDYPTFIKENWAIDIEEIEKVMGEKAKRYSVRLEEVTDRRSQRIGVQLGLFSIIGNVTGSTTLNGIRIKTSEMYDFHLVAKNERKARTITNQIFRAEGYKKEYLHVERVEEVIGNPHKKSLVKLEEIEEEV